MKKSKKERKTVSRRATLLSGLLIGALAFSAGVVGAGSRRSVEPGQTGGLVRTETESTGALEQVEPRWIAPSDQGKVDRRLPGHPELDLQLD